MINLPETPPPKAGFNQDIKPVNNLPMISKTITIAEPPSKSLSPLPQQPSLQQNNSLPLIKQYVNDNVSQTLNELFIMNQRTDKRVSDLENKLQQIVNNNNNNGLVQTVDNTMISNHNTLQQIQTNQNQQDLYYQIQHIQEHDNNYSKLLILSLVILLIIVLIITVFIGYYMLKPSKTKDDKCKHENQEKYTAADWFLMTALLLTSLVIIVVIAFLLLNY